MSLGRTLVEAAGAKLDSPKRSLGRTGAPKIMSTVFRDRTDAGRALAGCLAKFADRPDTVVLALPRGGVPVALEVARLLNAPLDIFLARKLGVPGHEELAMGALASGGIRVTNDEVIEALGISAEEIETVARDELVELERRERAYRGNRPPPDLKGRTVLVVDDGLATGTTMRAAIAALRTLGPEQVIVAVPIAAPSTCAEFQRIADDCICALTPEPFRAVGLWYEDFPQLGDEEVRELLAVAEKELPQSKERPAK